MGQNYTPKITKNSVIKYKAQHTKVQIALYGNSSQPAQWVSLVLFPINISVQGGSKS